MNKLLANKLKSNISLESKDTNKEPPKKGRQESNLRLLLAENFKHTVKQKATKIDLAALFNPNKKWKYDPFSGYDKSKMTEQEQRTHLSRDS